MTGRATSVRVVPVTSENWRDIAGVRPAEDQRDWVAGPTYYLCLSAYGGLWRSCGIEADGVIVGHVMWAVDPDDGSHWIGGLLVDARQQGRGIGRATVAALVKQWEGDAALSVSPDNEVALGLYRSLGFAETGEREDDEIVLRRPR